MARRSKKTLNLDLDGEANPTAPLDWAQFLASAQPVMKRLKEDLVARAKASASVAEALEARHEDEKAQKRTADSFLEWQDHFVEQVAAAWMLSCVFVRTLEDRGLLGHNRLAGPGAADSLKLFLDLAPSLNERDYLLTLFRELTRFAATRDLFDARHNPVWLLTPSAEGAKALVQLFQQPRAELPAFRFGQSDTSFLGWIYQDLDEGVRARFALLQTPRFIESFILDRTLEPALEKFGLDDTTLIDPTCGSGHFLLGAFERLVEHRLQKEPGLSPREAARRALDAVYGADLNPYAVAIARFRLTLAFFDKAGFTRLSDAPALPLHVVVADSLLHNPHLPQGDFADLAASAELWKGEEFALENEAEARAVLHRQFAAVVGNPPYITVKDSALRERYRSLYPRSAAGKYSIAAPFTERFFQLARERGRVGMITANSFMKREFGKKLIEQYLPTVNLDLVINTSGAYIPGHGTPTVLLFGSSEPSQGNEISTVLASRGEPSTPEDPDQGLVWRSIADHWREAGFENEYISVAKTAREGLAKHPWSLGGGGAAELKELLEERSEQRLGDLVEDIGFASFTGLDDAFILPSSTVRTLRLEEDVLRPMVPGEDVRDWAIAPQSVAIAPYSKASHDPLPLNPSARWARFLWRFRTNAKSVLSFGGKTREESGENWWQWYRWQTERYAAPYRITFAFVATHNHFVLDRGGKVFNRSAPIIKLPATATEDDHLALLAYLNSSTACFWMKQVSQDKGSGTDSGKWQDNPAKIAFEFTATQLEKLPLPDVESQRGFATSLVELSRTMLSLAEERGDLVVQAMESFASNPANPTKYWDDVRGRDNQLETKLVWLQEELDWLVYAAFGLCRPEDCSVQGPGEPRRMALGARPFEAAMLRAGSTVGLDGQRLLSAEMPSMDVRNGEPWARRLVAIGNAPLLSIIESPRYKRRWATTPKDTGGVPVSLDYRIRLAADQWLEARVELLIRRHGGDAGSAVRTATILSGLSRDDSFQAVYGMTHAEPLARNEGVQEILLRNSVPFLSPLRFAASGSSKRELWENTWHFQRREDAGEIVASIPLPPKYAQADYRSTTYWQLRGPLDVPKERFISYPGCESDQDGEPVFGWAGWDHEQRAKALATLYWNRKTEESWSKERLTPMLAGLLELLPWLKQWHTEASDEYAGDSAANYYAGFLDAECRAFGLTHDDLRAWRPAEKARGKRAQAKKAGDSNLKPSANAARHNSPRRPKQSQKGPPQ